MIRLRLSIVNELKYELRIRLIGKCCHCPVDFQVVFLLAFDGRVVSLASFTPLSVAFLHSVDDDGEKSKRWRKQRVRVKELNTHISPSIPVIWCSSF